MADMAVAGDAAWRERAQQLARDLALLQEDSLALSRAFAGAAADLAFQQECQAVMVDKLAEIRLRRLHEFLRVPESARALFLDKTKRAARRDHPTMPRRELRALLVEQWEALTRDEVDAWEARFGEYSALQPPASKTTTTKKKATPKLSVKTAAHSTHKGDSTAEAPPKKRKKGSGSAGVASSSPSPSTPSKKRAKGGKAGASSDLGTPQDAAVPTPKAAKGGRSRKPSPKKKAPSASPSSKSGKATAVSKPQLGASKAKAAKKKAAPAKKAPAVAKKKAKKTDKKVGLVEEGGKSDPRRDYSASDDDNEDEDEDEDENESLSGGSPSDDDSDDNMAQLPTGAFG